VRGFAVFAEALSVITDNHDNRAVEQAALVEKRNHPGKLEVDKADGARLATLAVGRCNSDGGSAGAWRVVEMQPRKEAAAANLAQPAKRIVNGTVRRASKRFAIDRPG